MIMVNVNHPLLSIIKRQNLYESVLLIDKLVGILISSKIETNTCTVYRFR